MAAAAGAGRVRVQIEPDWLTWAAVDALENLSSRAGGGRRASAERRSRRPRVAPTTLIRSFEVGRELAPDFVAFTGDFVSYRSSARDRRAGARAPCGARGGSAPWRVAGNHDYGRNWRSIAVADDISRVATDAGMFVLRNDVPRRRAPVRGPGGLLESGVRAATRNAVAGRRSSRRCRAASHARTPTRALLWPPRAGAPTVECCRRTPTCRNCPIWEGVRGWALAGQTRRAGEAALPAASHPPGAEQALHGGRIRRGPAEPCTSIEASVFSTRSASTCAELTLFTLTRAPAAVG